MKHRIYLAARFSLADEIREYARVLESKGHVVTSTWFDNPPTEVQLAERATTAESSAESLSLESWNERAWLEVKEVKRANMLVCFTPGGSRGGKHVEFGLMLARRLWSDDEVRLAVVGPRENLFHNFSFVEHYSGWAEFSHRLEHEDTLEAAMRRG